MGKIIKLLILFLLSLTLHANSAYQKQISEFDQNFSKSSTTNALKLHNSMKNIYIQSIIQDDKNLKIESLKRLVISSKKVNEDSTQYESELRTLGVDISTQANTKKTTQATINQPKTTQTKQIATQKATTQKTTTPAVQKLNIRKVSIENDVIVLDFTRPIKESEIKTFALKGKDAIRHVFDISGDLLPKSQTLKLSYGQVRVSQYDKTTTRIVVSSSKSLQFDRVIKDNLLSISQKGAKTTTNTSVKSTLAPKTSTKTTAPKTATVAPKATTSSVKKQNRIVVIDAGHGGKDAGAVNGKLYEKKAVLDLSLKLGNELKKRGYTVYYTRTADKYLKLADRTRVANDKDAHLFISVHANASPSKDRNASLEGIETYFLSPSRSERSKNVAALENKSDVEEMNYFSKQTFLNLLNQRKIVESNKVAIDVQRGILGAMKGHFTVKDGGVREAPFWVLVGAQMPSILLEIGYITHPNEVKRIFNDTYQNRFAIGVSDGVDAYFSNLQ